MPIAYKRLDISIRLSVMEEELQMKDLYYLLLLTCARSRMPGDVIVPLYFLFWGKEPPHMVSMCLIHGGVPVQVKQEDVL